MKINAFNLCLAVFLIMSPLFSVAQITFDKEGLINKISSEVSDLESQYILNLCPHPSGSFIMASDTFSVLLNYPTEVHESYHVANAILNPASQSQRKYVTFRKDQKLEFCLRSVPASSVIIDSLPKEFSSVSENMIELYLRDSSNDSSINGIYGLVEETLAYYHSIIAISDVLSFVEKNNVKLNAQQSVQMIVNFNDLINNYLKLRVFVFYYLRYLEYQRQECFEYWKDNSGLYKFLNKINSRFDAIVCSIDESLKRLALAQGNKIRVSESSIELVRDGWTYDNPVKFRTYLKMLVEWR